jgi:uncharacterized lipoprotein
MNPNIKLPRAIPLVALMLALAASSGCAWMRGKSGYEEAPEARPLEVPPDLDTPRVDPAMSIPEVAGGARRTPAITAGSPFTLADAADSAWRRVGIALERVEGVTVTDRAQLLSAYGVRYQGEEFLIRVSADGEKSRVHATTADGREASSAAAGKLLGLLKLRLG